MNFNPKHWQKLFLFCLGLAVAASLCMKWIEKDLVYQGSHFTVLELEFKYGQEELDKLLHGLDAFTRNNLQYHLELDFVFMLGVFPGIAALCMMARTRAINFRWKRFLFVLALLQTLAWACDITENLLLRKWTWHSIDSAFDLFHPIVYTKWIIAISGVLVAVPVLLRKKKS